jgi:hypothetical protein
MLLVDYLSDQIASLTLPVKATVRRQHSHVRFESETSRIGRPTFGPATAYEIQRSEKMFLDKMLLIDYLCNQIASLTLPVKATVRQGHSQGRFDSESASIGRPTF